MPGVLCQPVGAAAVAASVVEAAVHDWPERRLDSHEVSADSLELEWEWDPRSGVVVDPGWE